MRMTRIPLFWLVRYGPNEADPWEKFLRSLSYNDSAIVRYYAICEWLAENGAAFRFEIETRTDPTGYMYGGYAYFVELEDRVAIEGILRFGDGKVGQYWEWEIDEA